METELIRGPAQDLLLSGPGPSDGSRIEIIWLFL